VVMSNGNVVDRKKFMPIKTNSLMDNTSAHFDVYTLLDGAPAEAKPEDFLLYAKAPYTWSLRELTDLTRVGIQELFIDEVQRRNYERYLSLHKEAPEIDRNEEPRFRIRKIQDIGQHLVECCFLSEIDHLVVGRLESVANELVTCLLSDPKSVHQIQSLAEYDLYTYVHSVGVGTLTTAIAMKMGITDSAALHTYAMGGILHDVGKKLVPLAVLNKPGPLLPEEWEQMKAHPTTGLDLLKPLGLNENILEIVSSHHEKIDGSGYPDGLSLREIPIHVQVATVADIFNALTTTRCYHRKRSRFEALMFMKHNLRGKISADVFKALVACLVSEKELKRA
jgi:putative nucleotidyltransferase with HDIG domain